MSAIKEIRENLGYFGMAIRKEKKDYFFEGNYGPLVGFHGVFGSWPEEGLKDYMYRKNVRGVLANFHFLTKGIDHYLPKVEEYLDKYPNPIIIGYSAGGVLALRYASLNGFQKIQKIITVASPLASIHPLYGLTGKTMRDLSSGSSILKQILELKPPQNKVMSVFATSEIFTPEPGKIHLNWPVAILPASSHGQIQSNTNLIEPILDSELGIYGK